MGKILHTYRLPRQDAPANTCSAVGGIFREDLEHKQKFSTEYSEAKLERDPENEHRFILKIDGVNVFRWFRDMARKLLGNIRFRQPEPRQSNGIRR